MAEVEDDLYVRIRSPGICEAMDCNLYPSVKSLFRIVIVLVTRCTSCKNRMWIRRVDYLCGIALFGWREITRNALLGRK